MDNKGFQKWLSAIDSLSSDQLQKAKAVLSGESQSSASLAAIEASVGEERRCPHCQATGAISRGKARGLRRYQCKGCGKTFNAATGTPLSGLHCKEKWLEYANCLSHGMTVKATASHCQMANSTSFRWRHRFLAAKGQHACKLKGIVETDETYFLESRKGERNLNRTARKRGGKATKRGLSNQQVPVLMAADRNGTTVGAKLPAVTAEAIRKVIQPLVEKDIILVSDGHRAYPPCATEIGVRHVVLNLSKRKRVQGPFHIQTVNSRHSQLKGFMHRFNGVATKYLENYLLWFDHFELKKAHPRTCLASAIER